METGEVLIAPWRNPWRRVGPITGGHGKGAEGEQDGGVARSSEEGE